MVVVKANTPVPIGRGSSSVVTIESTSMHRELGQGLFERVFLLGVIRSVLVERSDFVARVFYLR